MIKAIVTFTFIFSLLTAISISIASQVRAEELPKSQAITPTTEISEFGRPSVRYYTDKDGLPHTAIMCLAFDKKGYLWVGTQDGAAYYSGNRWHIVNMPNRTASNYVRSMLVSADGSIWFATLGGGVLRLKDGSWTIYEKRPGQLPDNKIRTIWETVTADNRSIIWLGTYEQGLVRFENNSFTIYNKDNSGLPENSIQSIFSTSSADNNFTLWVGTYNSGLARFSDGKWTIYNTSNSALPDNSVQSILETNSVDKHRTLWIGTYNGGLARLQDNQWRIYQAENSGLLSNSVTCLRETVSPTGEQTIWAGSFGGGVSGLQSNDRWIYYNKKRAGISDNAVLCLLIVKSLGSGQTFWIGTLNRGITRLQDDKWFTVTSPLDEDLEDNSVATMFESRSKNGDKILWVCTHSGGLRKLENGNWVAYTTRNSKLPHNHVRCIIETDSKEGRALWLGTSKGLVKILGDQWTIYDTANSGLPSNNITSLLATTSPDGALTIWVGMNYRNLAKFENGVWNSYVNDPNLPFSNVNCLLETVATNGEKIIWAGTGGAGLARFQNGKWRLYDTKNSQLPNNSVMSLMAGNLVDGRPVLWVGTSAGVCRFEPEADQQKWLVFSANVKDGQTNNYVKTILRDRQGRIYLFTQRGVIRLTAKIEIPQQISDFDIYSFTSEDGLPSSVINSALLDSNNRWIWVGTANGLAVLDMEKFTDDRTAKPLFIEKILINGQDYRTTKDNQEYIGTGSNQLNLLKLDHNQNNLEIEFTLLSYFNESETLYRAQLSGFEAPSNWTSDYKRIYTNLSAGAYTFKVWGKDNAGNISGPLLIPIQIKTAPWRTWWAYLIYIFSIAGVGYGGSRLRLKVLENRNKELAALVTKRTQEIEKKSAQILDSLQYAERIQQAMLPHEERISNVADYFVLFKPKDIVSGDFYWFQVIDELTIIAVADCTGHGVPGAFMSMIGNALLNQIVIEERITDPAEILIQLHEGIRRSLKQADNDAQSQDGMDIAVCAIDLKQREIIFAGARRPLYYIKDRQPLVEIKGDRKPIGGQQKELKRVFKNHVFKIDNEIKLYLTSDGFSDQNSNDVIRYGSHRLKSFLEANANRAMSIQHQQLVEELNSFQNRESQRDDITIVGLQIALNQEKD